MGKRITARTWISIVTVALLAIIVFTSRHELLRAWELLWQVNLWKLSLIIPLQFLSYFAAAETMFSYLKKKGKVSATPWERVKMALELNFVNHILPSGGVSGASYMTWRLRHADIRPGRATLAQVVRLGVTFAAFLALMLIAVLMITLDGEISRFTLLVSSGIASTIIFSLLAGVYFVGSERRTRAAARFSSRNINRFGRKILRRHKPLVHEEKVIEFFSELHDDYKSISREWHLLRVPFVWGMVFTVAEVAMFWVAFWALGEMINPAPLLIAYGLAIIAGVLFITPGGAGGFEVLMIAFLATTGMSQSVIVAGVLLARTILVIMTIATGYIFYQQALSRYGKRPR